MERTVSAHLECDVTEPIDLVLSVAVAEGPTRRDESLSVTLGGKAKAPDERISVDKALRAITCVRCCTKIGGSVPNPVRASAR